MAVHTEGFRAAHEEIGEHTAKLRVAARMLPRLDRHEREVLRAEIVRFLREEVAPHMKLDEELLYPALARRIGDPLVASSMNYDHIAIRLWIDELEQTDAEDGTHLQQLLYGLDALIRVHLWKENELFLRPLENGSWPS
jgi:hypothetical protein